MGRGGCDGKKFDDLSIFDDFDAIADLTDDRARIASEERVAAQMFPALDRLEEEGFSRAADFAIGRKRRLKIGEQTAGDRNQVALRRQVQKLLLRWKIHTAFQHN